MFFVVVIGGKDGVVKVNGRQGIRSFLRAFVVHGSVQLVQHDLLFRRDANGPRVLVCFFRLSFRLGFLFANLRAHLIQSVHAFHQLNLLRSFARESNGVSLRLCSGSSPFPSFLLLFSFSGFESFLFFLELSLHGSLVLFNLCRLGQFLLRRLEVNLFAFLRRRGGRRFLLRGFFLLFLKNICVVRVRQDLINLVALRVGRGFFFLGQRFRLVRDVFALFRFFNNNFLVLLRRHFQLYDHVVLLAVGVSDKLSRLALV